MLQLRRMGGVITWFARIPTVRQTFVGFVLVPGNLMDLLGTRMIHSRHFFMNPIFAYFDCISSTDLYRYNCNRYDETEAKAARDAQEKSRSALQRYLFYCTRYMNHMQSLKFENKLYASVKDKMEEMQQHNMSWIEVQFLKKVSIEFYMLLSLVICFLV